MTRAEVTSWAAIGVTLAIALGGSLITYGANQADIEQLKDQQKLTGDMRARQERIDERTLATQRKLEEIANQQNAILQLLLRGDR